VQSGSYLSPFPRRVLPPGYKVPHLGTQQYYFRDRYHSDFQAHIVSSPGDTGEDFPEVKMAEASV
jgi:hypothetical protein